MAQIGIRELRQHASRYVHAAKEGEEITVTDRGVPVARLVPLSPLESHYQALITAGAVVPASTPRPRFSDLQGVDGDLSSLLEEDRADR